MRDSDSRRQMKVVIDVTDDCRNFESTRFASLFCLHYIPKRGSAKP